MSLNFADFLAEDFERLSAAAPRLALDGQRLMISGATGFFGKNLLALLAWMHDRGQRFEVVGLSRDPQRFFALEAWAARLPNLLYNVVQPKRTERQYHRLFRRKGDRSHNRVQAK